MNAALPTVGRARELADLEGLLDAVATGAGRLAVIEGESGIGKTRLLEDTLAQARARGFQTLSATAHELDRHRPFGAFADALGTHPEAAPAGLAGEPGRLQPYELPRVADALVDAIARLAAVGPVAVALDDLQWADAASLATVQRLGRRLPSLGVLALCAARPLPRPPELLALLDWADARGALRLVLRPLAASAVSGLVAALMGSRPDPGLLAHVEAGGGNPLFVIELVAALERGAGGQEALGAGGRSTPPSLRDALLARLTRLGGDPEHVLRIASVLGAAFSVADLAEMLERPVAQLLPALRDSLGAGILAEHGDRLGFRYDLLRDALYEDIPSPVRRALHHDAARVLARAGAPPIRLAEHVVRGAAPGDGEAAGLLQDAARGVAASMPAEAAALFGRALELAGADDPRRDVLLADRAVVLHWMGEYGEAEAICAKVLARPHDAAVTSRLLLCQSQCLLDLRRLDDAIVVATAATAASGLTGGERAHVRACGALARLFVSGRASGEAEAERAREEAVAAGDDVALCMAMHVLALARGGAGEFADALALEAEVVRLADGTPGQVGHRTLAHVGQALFLVNLDRFDEAIEVATRGQALWEGLGGASRQGRLAIAAGLAHFAAGRWDEAIAELDLGLVDIGAERLSWAAGGAGIRAIIALHRDDLATVERLIASGRPALSGAGAGAHAELVILAHALMVEATSGPDEAFSLLEAAWATAAARGDVLGQPILGPDLVRLATATGSGERVRPAVEGLERLVAHTPSPTTLAGVARRCRGLLDDDVVVLLEARSMLRTGPRPLERAAAAEDAAVALARRGDQRAARPLLEDALADYAALGARRDLARAEARMRGVGVRRGTRGARNHRGEGWAALTPAERRVAELVAEGLTNPDIAARLYVSRNTVHTHVAHVLSKLGCRSRTQVATVTARRDAEAGDGARSGP